MAGFEGTWECWEHQVKGNLTIGSDFDIEIKLNGSQYEVTKIPPLPGLSLPFPVVAKDQALSKTWTDGVSQYGVRLVFDNAVNPTQILQGPLCSVIERWSHKKHKRRIHQPDDMGTITGTKGKGP
jgi:hypothetical protein